MAKEDLSKLTKEQLIDLIEDRGELRKLIKNKETEIKTLKEKHQEEVAQAMEREKKRSEQEIEELKQTLTKHQEYIQGLQNRVNETLMQYTSLLKVLQGVTDSHIYINEQLSKGGIK